MKRCIGDTGWTKWFDSYLDYLIVEKLGSVPDYMLFGEMAHGKQFSGKVRVIEEPGKVEDEYDIILIHSADPDYLPYVTRCKGIIAERGGVLSHTAILARELNIPCVVGVSNASLVIKDGDYVKVIDGGVYVWNSPRFQSKGLSMNKKERNFLQNQTGTTYRRRCPK